MGITSYNNLRTVETEKARKYDLLANYLGSLHGFQTRIIPFVITWDGIVTTFHKNYCMQLGVDDSILPHMQFKAIKMTLESMSFDHCRRIQTNEGTLEKILTLSSLEGVIHSRITI